MNAKPLLPLILLPLTALAGGSIPPALEQLDGHEFVHCYDFGCKSRQGIDFDAAQWAELTDIFNPPAADAAEEKQRIRAAVARMETFAGAITGSEADLGGNYNGRDLPKQQDCIDESTNTLQYLLALERRGWLRFHRVDLKQRRIVWFISHWTATIREIDNGQIFAVDSWFRDNGEPPYLQAIEDWRRDRDFPAALNPPLKTVETAAR